MVSQKYITKNAQETFSLGESIGKKIKEGTVFCLYGELGSGKTTFVQGLTSGLKIRKRIISPTFVFVRQYKLRIKSLRPRANNLCLFYHIDLYRVKTLNDAVAIGVGEILKEKGAVVAIEWAEKIKEILPKKRIDIFFKYIDEEKRRIVLKFNS